MKRAYFEEDIQLIRKYFPGAKTVALHTPFDLTNFPEDPWVTQTDRFKGETNEVQWYGDLLWNQ